MPTKRRYTSAKQILKDLYSKNLDLYKERKRLHEILTQVAEVIFAVDEDYRLTLFNSSAEEVFKVKAEEVIGKKADTVMKMYLDDTETKASVKDFCFKTSVHKAFEDLKCEGETPIRIGKKDPKEGGSDYFKINFANISVKEKGADECVVSLTNITDEVEIDKQKDEFISIASHELKTPITIIKTNLWMFKHVGYEKMDEKQRHFIKEMDTGLIRLSKIVNNLLDISRIEQGRFVLDEKQHNFDSIINESMDFFEEVVEKKGLKLVKPKTKIGNWVVDKDRFREALDNLISNAIKYTDSGGIKVEVKKDTKQLTVTVTDSGPGISVSDQNRLFKKFSRAKEGLKQERPGASTGLGLYITKRIIEEMGGKVGVRSKVGAGSTFWFSIPKKKKSKSSGVGSELTHARVEAIKQEVKGK
jgi:signal transduction histidine kinase